LDEGKGANFVDKAASFLAFITTGYLESANCMRELLRAVLTKKPVTLVLEPNAAKGGMVWPQIEEGLRTALTRLPQWGLDKELLAWYESGATICEVASLPLVKKALLASPTLLFTRTRVLLDPTLRFISEKHVKRLPKTGSRWRAAGNLAAAGLRLAIDRTSTLSRRGSDEELSKIRRPPPTPTAEKEKFSGHAGITYLVTEVTRKKVVLPPPRGGRTYHVFCSKHNSGASEIMDEVERIMGITIVKTSDPMEMLQCEFLCMLLDARTWTSGEQTERFANEVHISLRANQNFLLCHEEPGHDGAARHAVPFDAFFVNDRGATPRKLVNAGIYHKIALPMQGGGLRSTSLAIVAQVMCAVHDGSSRLARMGSAPKRLGLSRLSLMLNRHGNGHLPRSNSGTVDSPGSSRNVVRPQEETTTAASKTSDAHGSGAERRPSFGVAERRPSFVVPEGDGLVDEASWKSEDPPMSSADRKKRAPLHRALSGSNLVQGLGQGPRAWAKASSRSRAAR